MDCKPRANDSLFREEKRVSRGRGYPLLSRIEHLTTNDFGKVSPYIAVTPYPQPATGRKQDTGMLPGLFRIDTGK